MAWPARASASTAVARLVVAPLARFGLRGRSGPALARSSPSPARSSALALLLVARCASWSRCSWSRGASASWPSDFVDPRFGVTPSCSSSCVSSCATRSARRSVAVRRSWRASRTRLAATAGRCPAPRTPRPARAALCSAMRTTSSTSSCARSRVTSADPSVLCTVRSTARRTASGTARGAPLPEPRDGTTPPGRSRVARPDTPSRTMSRRRAPTSRPSCSRRTSIRSSWSERFEPERASSDRLSRRMPILSTASSTSSSRCEIVRRRRPSFSSSEAEGRLSASIADCCACATFSRAVKAREIAELIIWFSSRSSARRPMASSAWPAIRRRRPPWSSPPGSLRWSVSLIVMPLPGLGR